LKKQRNIYLKSFAESGEFSSGYAKTLNSIPSQIQSRKKSVAFRSLNSSSEEEKDFKGRERSFKYTKPLQFHD